MGRALQHSLISNLFSLFRLYKFPVRTLAAIRQKCPRVRDIVTKITAAQVPFSRISLYFSLLAGILGRRPVRDGLGRQPEYQWVSLFRIRLDCCDQGPLKNG